MENVNVTKKSYNFKETLAKLFKKFSLARLLDWIFFNLCIFLFLLAWIRFVTKSFATSVAISLVILAGLNVLRYALRDKRRPATSQKQLLDNTKDFFINYM